MTRSLSWWTHMAERLRDCARGQEPLLDSIRELRDELGYDAALLVISDRQGKPTTQAVNLGYSTEVASYLRGHYVDACPGYAWATAEQAPTRFVDLPFDFRACPSFLGVLGPAGFDEGITIPFVAPFSGWPGFLAMSSRHAKPLDEDSRLALALLGPTIGSLSQPESSFGPTWCPATHLLRVDSTGLRPVMAQPVPTFVSEQNLIVLASTIGTNRPALGMQGQDESGSWWRLNVIDARDSAAHRCVLIRIAPSKPSLTHRELDVCGAIRAGLDNNAVAHLLGISIRTVKTHLEHATAALGVTNRTELAVAAWTQDLSSINAELRLVECSSVVRPRPSRHGRSNLLVNLLEGEDDHD